MEFRLRRQGGKRMAGRGMAGRPKRAAALVWPFYGAFALTALSGSVLMSLQEGLNMVPSGPAMNPHISSVTTLDPWGNPCATMMDTMKGMSVMGESMEAMMDHMCITPLRPEQSGDAERAKALVEQVGAVIEK